MEAKWPASTCPVCRCFRRNWWEFAQEVELIIPCKMKFDHPPTIFFGASRSVFPPCKNHKVMSSIRLTTATDTNTFQIFASNFLKRPVPNTSLNIKPHLTMHPESTNYIILSISTFTGTLKWLIEFSHKDSRTCRGIMPDCLWFGLLYHGDTRYLYQEVRRLIVRYHWCHHTRNLKCFSLCHQIPLLIAIIGSYFTISEHIIQILFWGWRSNCQPRMNA